MAKHGLYIRRWSRFVKVVRRVTLVEQELLIFLELNSNLVLIEIVQSVCYCVVLLWTSIYWFANVKILLYAVSLNSKSTYFFHFSRTMNTVVVAIALAVMVTVASGLGYNSYNNYNSYPSSLGIRGGRNINRWNLGSQVGFRSKHYLLSTWNDACVWSINIENILLYLLVLNKIFLEVAIVT